MTKAFCGALLLLVLTLEMSVSEFVEVHSLSDDARRARFNLTEQCVPLLRAMKPAVANSSRVIVLIDCRPREAAAPDQPKPIPWDQRDR